MKRFDNFTGKTLITVLALTLSLAMTGCGGKKEEAPQESAEVVEESTEVQDAVDEAINPEQVAVEPAEEPEEEPVAEAAAEAVSVPEEPEVIDKPVPTEADSQAKEEADAAKEEESSEEASGTSLDLLDGVMTFDGMELSFPIEFSSMTLGNWKITFKDVEDPSSRMLMPSEYVEAEMTCSAYTEDDVTVTAEFGNYSDSEKPLSEIPMTGIYIRKGKGTADKEPKLPEVVLPGDLTWGSTKDEIRDLLGEASLSGGFIDADFDFMYENGSFMLELAGSNDNGVDYIVYSME